MYISHFLVYIYPMIWVICILVVIYLFVRFLGINRFKESRRRTSKRFRRKF